MKLLKKNQIQNYLDTCFLWLRKSNILLTRKKYTYKLHWHFKTVFLNSQIYIFLKYPTIFVNRKCLNLIHVKREHPQQAHELSARCTNMMDVHSVFLSPQTRLPFYKSNNNKSCSSVMQKSHSYYLLAYIL